MKRTIYFKNKPKIIETYSVCGPKEGEGELGKFVDLILKNDMFDEKTFEKAEIKMMHAAIKGVMDKSNKTTEEINAILSGDLLNQIISASFSAREFDIGFLGLYNACSTFTEGLTLGTTLIDANHFDNVIVSTSSHFSSAERQYRYPLELGSTRPPLSQWTVTGAGAVMLSLNGDGPSITLATIGRIVDYGVVDVNNMGAAMAPAACDTLCTLFRETNTVPTDYDLIITGDLGTFGSRIFKDLVWEKGFDIEKEHIDCGELVYNIKEDEFQGGSGAGCSSMVFSSYFYKQLKKYKNKKFILMATGALLSSVSSQQGESIPGIAHAVVIES